MFIPEMFKMPHFFHILLFCICFLGLTRGQESIEYLHLHDTNFELLHGGIPVAVPVRGNDIVEVSSSVLMAEAWLRTHVLAYFPSTKITTILVGEGDFFCKKDQEHSLGLVLPSLENVYHSLKRWGLETDIKVSAFLGSDCLREGFLVEKSIKPLLEFLKSTNSSFSVHLPHFRGESLNLLSSHKDLMKKFESFELGKVTVQGYVKKFESFGSRKINVQDFMKKLESFESRKINVQDLMKEIEPLGVKKINFIISTPNERKRMSRKLSAMESKLIDPFPARPTPLPEASPSSIHSSIGFSEPAHIAKSPHLQNSPTITPPPLSLPTDSPPSPLPPAFAPANPPFGFSLPPCNPYNAPAPAPYMGAVQKLWCVAKPSVPAESLQEAIDYACREGGADCQEIMPNGRCYNPDTVVAHASYAFNSYWQKTKRNGGTCSFGGTAMIISADPSFLQCRFVLT